MNRVVTIPNHDITSIFLFRCDWDVPEVFMRCYSYVMPVSEMTKMSAMCKMYSCMLY